MAWTFWMPQAPTNLTGSLVAGGTLNANTTYYFRVFAWDQGNTNTTRSGLNQQNPQVLSPYSTTFSITTDTVNKSVALTWDQVFKRNGVTEVDAYEVLVSTSDNFDTAPDNTQLSATSYFNPSSATNSYTVIAKPTVLVKNTHLGLPLMEWNGVGSGTSFEALYAALQADATYNIFARTLNSFYDPTDIYAYHFMGSIYITRWTGDSSANQYSFTSLGNVVVINGTLVLPSQKMNLQGNLITVNGQTHANSSYTPMSGSIVVGNYFKAGVRNYSGKSYYAYASGWASFATSVAGATIDNNINQIYENAGDSLTGAETLISTPGWASASPSGAKGAYYPRLDFRGSSTATFLNNLNVGVGKKVYLTLPQVTTYPSNFGYGTSFNFAANPLAITYQSTSPNWGTYDCLFSYATTGWDLSVNTMLKNFTLYQGKGVRVVVKDGNNTPLVGAKVSFYSSTGINLTRGNSATDVAKVTIADPSTGNNYDTTEATIHHNDTNITIRENTGSIGYTPIKENTDYWFGAEKLKIIARGAITAWSALNRWCTAQRGLDGTPTCWIIGSGGYYGNQFCEALPYVLTDANGLAIQMLIGEVYKANQTYTGVVSTGVSTGKIDKTDWFPLKVKISYPGKQDRYITISKAVAIAIGLNPINLEVNMDSQVGFIQTLDGDLVLNLSPEMAVNPDGWVGI